MHDFKVNESDVPDPFGVLTARLRYVQYLSILGDPYNNFQPVITKESSIFVGAGVCLIRAILAKDDEAINTYHAEYLEEGWRGLVIQDVAAATGSITCLRLIDLARTNHRILFTLRQYHHDGLAAIWERTPNSSNLRANEVALLAIHDNRSAISELLEMIPTANKFSIYEDILNGYGLAGAHYDQFVKYLDLVFAFPEFDIEQIEGAFNLGKRANQEMMEYFINKATALVPAPHPGYLRDWLIQTLEDVINNSWMTDTPKRMDTFRWLCTQLMSAQIPVVSTVIATGSISLNAIMIDEALKIVPDTDDVEILDVVEDMKGFLANKPDIMRFLLLRFPNIRTRAVQLVMEASPRFALYAARYGLLPPDLPHPATPTRPAGPSAVSEAAARQQLQVDIADIKDRIKDILTFPWASRKIKSDLHELNERLDSIRDATITNIQYSTELIRERLAPLQAWLNILQNNILPVYERNYSDRLVAAHQHLGVPTPGELAMTRYLTSVLNSLLTQANYLATLNLDEENRVALNDVIASILGYQTFLTTTAVPVLHNLQVIYKGVIIWSKWLNILYNSVRNYYATSGLVLPPLPPLGSYDPAVVLSAADYALLQPLLATLPPDDPPVPDLPPD